MRGGTDVSGSVSVDRPLSLDIQRCLAPHLTLTLPIKCRLFNVLSATALNFLQSRSELGNILSECKTAWSLMRPD